MKIKNKLTNRVYRAHKVHLVVDDDILCEAHLPQHDIESLIASFAVFISEYELR